MHVHSSLRLSIFDFSSLKEAFSVRPKVPMRFIQVDGHREAQISAQLCSIQLDSAQFLTFCHRLVSFWSRLPFLSLHLTQPYILAYVFRGGV